MKSCVAPWYSGFMFSQADTDFNIDRHLIKLLEESPFFAEISRHVRKVVTNDLPTAGVTFDKYTDDFVLGINPEFFGELKDEEIAGVLRHEFYHIIFFHITTRRKTPHMRWNVATDLAINSIILDPSSGKNVALPDCALVPGRPLIKAGKGKEHKAAAKLSNLIASLPSLESSDYYWNRLSELADELQGDCPVHGDKGNTKGGSGAQGEKDDGNPGHSKGGKADDAEGGKGDDATGQGKDSEEDGEQNGHGSGHSHNEAGEDECTCGASSMDDHGGWDDVPEDMREYVEGKARALTEKAAKHADSRSNGWGNMPTSVRDDIRRMVSRVVDWKAVLRQFVGSICRGDRVSTIRRINRKYPYIHPGVKRGYVAKLAIAIDQSGSVHDDMLASFFSELSALTKKVSVTIIPFDADVDPREVYEWRKGSQVNLKRVKSGGTSFDAPTRFVNDAKNRGRWDGLLVMTDGECSQPTPSRIKRGWVLGAGQKLYFNTDEMQVSMDKGTPTRGAWR